MNELKVFESGEFGELNVMEIDGRMYFPATACAKKLGYQDAINAIKQHCKGVVKHHLPTNGGMQAINMIPEGDLYRLITHSKLPSAERFEKWVFDEVLPAIRRTGGYGMARSEIVDLVRDTVQQAVSAMITLHPCDLKKKAAPKYHRHCGRHPSIIGRLDASIRQEIETMLLSRRYTYNDIREHLLTVYGVHVSQSAIGRYAASITAKNKEKSCGGTEILARIYLDEC